jgi:peroxidase
VAAAPHYRDTALLSPVAAAPFYAALSPLAAAPITGGAIVTPVAAAPFTARAIVAPVASAPVTGGGALFPYFHVSSCSQLDVIVRSSVRAAIKGEMTLAAGLLRAFFHDCFPSGALKEGFAASA